MRTRVSLYAGVFVMLSPRLPVRKFTASSALRAFMGTNTSFPLTRAVTSARRRTAPCSLISRTH